MRNTTWIAAALILLAAGCSDDPGKDSDAGMVDGGADAGADSGSGVDAGTDTDSLQDSDVDTESESEDGEIVCNGSYCDTLVMYCECMIGKFCGSSYDSTKECVENEAGFEKACPGSFNDYVMCRLGCCQNGIECQDVNRCLYDNQCNAICL